MIETLVLVNGEEFWSDYFPEYQVHHVRLQTSKWLLNDGKLWVYDNGLKIRVDSLLWRIGAVQPYPNHRDILELVRFSGVPCLNPAELLLRDLHRLTMLNDLKELNDRHDSHSSHASRFGPILLQLIVFAKILAHVVFPTPRGPQKR